jgi:ABC-type sugar transport system substrate-binding protein
MSTISRRTFMLAATAMGAIALAGSVAYAELPALAKKNTYKVGFAQTESNNPWRIAQTNSMKERPKSSATSWSIPMLPVPLPSRWPTSTR